MDSGNRFSILILNGSPIKNIDFITKILKLKFCVILFFFYSHASKGNRMLMVTFDLELAY